MLRKLTCWLLTTAAAALIALANAGAASACLIYHYQPELPESLKKY